MGGFKAIGKALEKAGSDVGSTVKKGVLGKTATGLGKMTEKSHEVSKSVLRRSKAGKAIADAFDRGGSSVKKYQRNYAKDEAEGGKLGRSVNDTQNRIQTGQTQEERIRDNATQATPATPGSYEETFGGIARPTYSGYASPQGIAGIDTLNPGYKLETPANLAYNKIDFTAPQMANMEAAQQMKNIGMGKVESPWMKLQLAQNELNKNQMLNAASGQLGGANAAARGALAMRGGMNTGSRERLARGGARDLMRSTQDIYGLKQGGDLQAQIQAGKDQQSMLGQAAGMEADLGKFGASGAFEQSKAQAAGDFGAGQYNAGMAMDAGKYNIDNLMQNKSNQAAFDMKKYEEEMKAAAANKLGNVMGTNPPKGTGGVLGGLGIQL